MTKILVLPDIHDKVILAQKIIDSETFDCCFCLGDYFDGVGSDDFDTENTAKWLKEKIEGDNNEKFYFLKGNHDCGYFMDKDLLSFFWASRYEESRRKIVEKYLGDYFSIFKLGVYDKDSNILFTHAGATNPLIDFGGIPFSEILPIGQSVLNRLDFLNEDAHYLFKRVKQGLDGCELNEEKEYLENLDPEIPAIYGVGPERGGRQKFGGITWCDFSRLIPTYGLNQIFGHTVQKNGPTLREINIDEFGLMDADEPYKDTSLKHGSTFKVPNKFDRTNSVNLALDTGLKYYAIVEDGVVTIKASPPLK